MAVVYLVLLYLVAWWRTSASLAAAWKLSDEVGLPNDAASLRGAPVPPDQNMAFVLDRAAKLASEFEGKEIDERVLQGDDRSLYDVPERLPLIDELMGDAEYESLLKQAATMKDYYRPSPPNVFRSGPPDYFGTRRSFARIERAAARRLATTGQFEAAALRLLRTHALFRQCLRHETMLLEILVNEAICSSGVDELLRMMRRGVRFSPAIYEAIERELAATDEYRQLLLLSTQFDKFVLVEGYLDVLTWQRLFPFKPIIDSECEFIVRLQHRRVRTCSKPFAEVRDELKQMDAETSGPGYEPDNNYFPRGRWMVGHFALGARTALERMSALNHCVRIVNALARTHDVNADFESLGLPPECLIDPFDGKRLRIKQTPKGPIVYSVGEDLVDDDGDIFWKDNPPAAARDVGISLFEQEAR